MLRSSVVLNGNLKLKTNLARRLHSYFMLCKYSIDEFKIRLSCESWDCVFGNNDNMDVDSLFSAFLNNYLRLFYTSFPLQKIIERHDNESWITACTKISCNHKRELYLLRGDSNDTNLNNYYKQYCKILTCYQRSKNVYIS